MKLIVGLGNPGAKYEASLHNLGFMVIDALSSRNNISLSFSKKVPGHTGKGGIESEDVVLAKPSTFVNESGRAVKYLLDYFHFSVPDLIVVCDDLDLDAGRIRIKEKGNSGGHRGLNSIIDHIGGPDFFRIRIGIGRPPVHVDPSDYVLRTPTKDGKVLLARAVERASESIHSMIKDGPAAAMNTYNRKEDGYE